MQLQYAGAEGTGRNFTLTVLTRIQVQEGTRPVGEPVPMKANTFEPSRIPWVSKRGDGLGCRQHVHCRHGASMTHYWESGGKEHRWSRKRKHGRRVERLSHPRNA
jgi:hypothetical protein